MSRTAGVNSYFWVVVTLACAPTDGPPAGRPLSIDDLVRLATPTGVQISPDGTVVLYTLAMPDSAGLAYEEGIWRVPAAGGTPTRLVADGIAPRWSPDGTRIAFLSAHERRPQLWITDSGGGPPSRVTDLTGGVLDYEWSPDGARIAVVASTRDTAGTGVRPQIHLVDLASGLTRQLTRSTRSIIVHVWDPGANLSWSPDGGHLAYSEKPSPRFDDDYRSDVYVVSVADGTTRALVERPGLDQRPSWSPDGRWIAFRSSFGETHRFRAAHGLAIVSSAGGTPVDAGRSFDGGFLDGPYGYAWDAAGEMVYFTGAAPEGTAVFTLAVPSGRVERLTPAPGKWSMLSLASRADRVAFVMSDPGTPWEVYASPRTRYDPVRLTHVNQHLEGRLLPAIETVRWESDGHQLTGVLLTPPGFARGRGYPMVTYLHGGPEGQGMAAFAPELPSPVFDAWLSPHHPQALAAGGFVVFLPNFRGSGGRGRVLREAGLGDWSAQFVADVERGVDAMVTLGIADSTRLGLIGARSGGSKVISVLGRTARFAAASILDAHVDFVLEYQSSSDFRDYWLQLIGASPTNDSVAFARHSPINRADSITTPVQIITVEGAWEVPSEQAIALHRRLLRRGVPGELLLARAPALPDRAEQARRVVAWFDRWLGGS